MIRIACRPVTRLAGALLLAAALFVWTRPASPVGNQNSDTAELTTKETTPTFTLQAQRNLVLVRVVVRDSKGRIVGNLQKDDFRLLDNGKPQAILQFSMEPAQPGASTGAKEAPAPPAGGIPGEATATVAASLASRFLALYFDDVHTRFEDIMRGRDAAERFVATALQPGDRTAVFTATGEYSVDFTSDRDKLHEALSKLQFRPRGGDPKIDCPEITDYQADLIINRNDAQALKIAVDEAIQLCDMAAFPTLEQMIRMQAQRTLDFYGLQSRYSLQSLENLARRMAAMPGQRTIILVSPGFMPLDFQSMVEEIVDRALRSNVVISSLDPKGLAVLMPFADAATNSVVGNPRLHVGVKNSFITQREFAATGLLAELAEDTGGQFFHNNNDLEAGFRKVAATPESSYILAFSPQNLKLDGKFHKLKVQLAAPKGFEVLARRGYFAPRTSPDSQAQAEEEIAQAAFSHDELQELPVEVRTQFFKTAGAEAQLSVLAHLDLHALRFRKAEARNLDDLRFVTVLFDSDGHFVEGKEQRVELRLRDATLERLLKTGVTVKATFKVKPGTYEVREVVRDAEGGQLSGLNSLVEIPF